MCVVKCAESNFLGNVLKFTKTFKLISILIVQVVILIKQAIKIVSSINISHINKQLLKGRKLLIYVMYMRSCSSTKITIFVLAKWFFKLFSDISNILKMTVDVYGYAYAATVAAGGILGYVKAGKCLQVMFIYVFNLHFK